MELERLSEAEKVELWREDTLHRAGYPDDPAHELAIRTDIDLHEAVDLVVERHCPPELALEILR